MRFLPFHRAVRSIVILLFVVLCGLSGKARAFTHPCIPTTLDDLDHIKANLDKEPWKSGYAVLAAHPWFPPSQGHLDHQRSGYPTMDLLERRRPSMAIQPDSVMH